MFATKFALAALCVFSAVLVAFAAPTSPSPRADWKTELGWDGKVTTPAELDPSNAVKPTPGKPAAAIVNGGVYFCTDANFQGRCVYVTNFSSGQCVGVGPDFNDNVSSFGPDRGLSCTIFRYVLDIYMRAVRAAGLLIRTIQRCWMQRSCDWWNNLSRNLQP
ncbi:hypothetical protein FRC08_005821 [Ceratobasidium sp. 394]|nr:hypothetical protein FRC08_005821 [Ceratobasidium sp. 394]